jgi:hypothetical protein
MSKINKLIICKISHNNSEYESKNFVIKNWMFEKELPDFYMYFDKY